MARTAAVLPHGTRISDHVPLGVLSDVASVLPRRPLTAHKGTNGHVLALAGNLFQARLFDRLREAEGATYSPNAAHLSSETFENWGIFYASAEVRPESVPAFFRAAREIIADLAARPVSQEEFLRSHTPVIRGIERRLATNGYWIEALENWVDSPEDIEAVRSYLADYRAMTPADVQRAIATYVVDQGDWSMVVLPARETSASEGQSAG